MNYKTDTKKGKYKVINPEKYLGSKNPIYKSGWERKVFDMMDRNPNIVKWGYECIEIYYANPIKGKFTVYYPDVYCHLVDVSGEHRQFLIEIKPAKMCIIPPKPKVPVTAKGMDGNRYKKAMMRYNSALADYMVNMAKWEAAQRFCLKHKIKWLILNDENSGLFKSR
jgi:hypothetical protein